MERHLILTHGRSGSNFLANSLNQHPEVVNLGEVLGEWNVLYKLYQIFKYCGVKWSGYLDILYTSTLLFYAAQLLSLLSHLRKGEDVNFKLRSRVKSIGLKDFAFLIDKRGLRKYLSDREDMKVIYLTRRNHFKRYLSLLNMKATGVVVRENSVSEKNIYEIDINDLLKNIKTFKDEEQLGDKLVAELNESRVFNIDYDDYFSNIERIHDKLFGFLGVAPIMTKSTHKKILSNDIREHISNYQAVADAMTRAGYGEYIL